MKDALIHRARRQFTSRLIGTARSCLISMLDHTMTQHCALCAQPVPINERADSGWPNQICHWCVDALPGSNRPRCPVCALPFADSKRCSECRAIPPAFFATHALADYALPLDTMLQQLKYGSRLSIARTLGQTICRDMQRVNRPLNIEFPAWPDLIVAVPLSASRMRTRGYNQAALLARDIGKRLRIRFRADALERVNDLQTSQTTKTRAQRFAAMRGQFIAKDCVSNCRVALVDDVMTTGATVNAVAGALLDQGAISVRVITMARTQ